MSKRFYILFFVVGLFFTTQQVRAVSFMVGPDTLHTKEEIVKWINEEIGSSTLKKELVDEKNKAVDEIEKKLQGQQDRYIEIMGLFAAILALIIINVSVVKSASDSRTAIFLIFGLTASMAMFAGLMHGFFSGSSFSKDSWIVISISGILLVALVVVSVFKNFKVKHDD